jgi:hypothetical protein
VSGRKIDAIYAAVVYLRGLDLAAIRAERLADRARMEERGWGPTCFESDLRLVDAMEKARADIECALREPSDESCGVASVTQPHGQARGEIPRTSRSAAHTATRKSSGVSAERTAE